MIWAKKRKLEGLKMEKNIEKTNVATRVSRSSKNALHRLGLFMFYHLAHQRDTRSDLTLEN